MMKERFMTFHFNPIGIVNSSHKNKYDAHRQGVDHKNVAEIILNEKMNFETALLDLDGFEYIWIIFLFHHNKNWKPKVLPPRQPRVKRGVFATRAPYRPNPVGISAVKLLEIKGRTVIIANHDLLDQTPILDIKPYIPYADSFPDAQIGWLETVSTKTYQLKFSELAKEKLAWLDQNDVLFTAELEKVLVDDPFPHPYRRIKEFDGYFEYYYQKWYCKYTVDNELVEINDIFSVLDTERAINESEELHQKFIKRYE
jgi:tRNA (adenine37-N6)-methyltransferase